MGLSRPLLKKLKKLFGKQETLTRPRIHKSRYEKEQEHLSIILDTDYTQFKSFKDVLKDARKAGQNPWAFYLSFIPSSQAYINVRSYLEWLTGDYKVWQSIRNQCEKNAGGFCEICLGTALEQGKKHRTECHEVWQFENGVQKLVTLLAVCKRCHDIYHMDAHAKEEDYFKTLLRDFEFFNNIDSRKAERYYQNTFKKRQLLDTKKFTLDLSFVKGPEKFDCHGEEFQLFLKTYKEKD